MKNGDALARLNSDAILNSIADGVVAIGLDRKVLFINRAAKDILRRSGAEDVFLGQDCRKIIGHSACTFDCLVRNSIETGEHIYDYEVEVGKRNKKVLLSIDTVLLKDENGKAVGGIEIFRDMSLIKNLKDALKGKYSLNNVVGKNFRMHKVYKILHEAAPTKVTVLIQGDSGTGKELIANAIHYNSPRSDRSFVKVNCAALSDGLIESELFGHVKGSFTGAIADKPGRFELADGGSLFFDEIGDIPPRTQAKLLRVLQEGEFERVGGTRTIKVDVRIIAATNKDLKALVEAGEFREDLFYRLKVIPIQLPPLRDRKDDIPHLVKHFTEKFNEEMKGSITSLSPLAMDLLMEYHYPGNIRELENIIEHAFVRCQGRTVLPEHLPKELSREAQKADIIDRVIQCPEPLKELEKETIIRVLNETNWKQLECAKRLNISRITLWRKMKDLNIGKDRSINTSTKKF